MPMRLGGAWAAVVMACAACGGTEDGPGTEPGDFGVTLLSPTGTVYTNGTVAFELEVTGEPDSVTLVVDGEGLFTLEAPWRHDWDTSGQPEGTYEVQARARRGDDTLETESVTIVVDRTPPTVVRTSPADGDDASVGHSIDVEISEPLLAASVTDDVAEVSADGSALDASVTPSDDGTHLAIDPAWPDPVVAIEVAINDSATDLAGNALVPASFSLALPWWSSIAPESAPANRGAVYALDAADRPVVAWMEINGQGPFAQRFDGSAWVDLGRAIAETEGMWLGGLEVDQQDRPVIVTWHSANGTSDTVAVRHDGTSWSLVGGGPLDVDPAHGTSGAAATRDASGAIVVSWFEGDASDGSVTGNVAAHIRRIDGDAIDPMGAPLDALGRVDQQRPNVAFDSTGAPWVAWSSNDGPGTLYRLHLARWDGGQWVMVSAGDPPGAENPRVADLAMMGDVPAVAWYGYDHVSHEAFVSTPDGNGIGGGWRHLGGRALDVDLRSDAFPSDLVEDGRGGLVAMWHERPNQRVLAARFDGAEWRALGPVINADHETPAIAGTVRVDSRARVVAAFRETTGGDWARQKVLFKRYNGGDVSPLGLDGYRTETTCAIGAGGGVGNDVVPATLTETGCYADVAARIPADGLVPFDINSVLWSDGAGKRRFLILPPGGTIGFTETGAWQMPAGTILMKEFLIGGVPMETRFLVMRAEGVWEGFSYQWNDEGTEGYLLADATTTKDWAYTDDTGNAAIHTHEYPSRAQCVRCHHASVGFVLGLQTPQMNRRLDYGVVGGNVDEQLRTLDALGAFGDTMPDVEPSALPRLGNYVDWTLPLEQRVRSYLHSNCSHCHNPGGERATRDFRWDTPLADTNLCGEVVPGDAAGSLVYQRDGARPGMPPLATLQTDDYWLGVLGQWIGSIAACP